MLEFKVFQNKRKEKFMFNFSSMKYIFMFFPLKVVSSFLKKKQHKVFNLLLSFCSKSENKKTSTTITILFVVKQGQKRTTALLSLSSL
jgi:hypothetical protein